METIPAEFIKNFVLIIAGLAALAVYGKELFGAKKRREVSFEVEPASKAEFDKHVEWNRREHENLFSKIGGVERGLGAQIKTIDGGTARLIRDEVGGVHVRVNALEAGVSGLTASTAIQSGELTEIKRDIKLLLQRKS